MDTTEYIEDYLNHRLTAAEQQQFSERLKSDPAFAAEVKEHILLLNAFDEAQANELSQRFNALEEKIRQQKGGKQYPLTAFLKWAAAILMLAVISSLFYLTGKHDKQALFFAYYQAYPNVESPVSRSGTAQQDRWLYYEQGNYAEAAGLFKGHLAGHPADIADWFYLGICELEQGKTKAAAESFSKVIAANGNKYAAQAQWYLALSYLRAGKTTAAKNELRKIVASGSDYHDRAKALLEKLD